MARNRACAHQLRTSERASRAQANALAQFTCRSTRGRVEGAKSVAISGAAAKSEIERWNGTKYRRGIACSCLNENTRLRVNRELERGEPLHDWEDGFDVASLLGYLYVH